MNKVLKMEDQLNVAYCIPTDLRDQQIKINIGKVSGRIQHSEELTSEPIAIVAFAPSLNETWEELKKFKTIMTCSGAHKFLLERGVTPTYHLDLDPREHKVKILGKPHADVQYLIASTIHPSYLNMLEGYNVKLWHIFANDEEGSRVLPKGEWMICGGSSVGLRCFTVARFLGYTNFHVFGMDGSFKDGNTHTTEHPNPPKEQYITEYDGVSYFTTPSVLHVAKETFRELDQMPDITYKFYGEGLVQAMSKNHKPNIQRNTLIAFNKPELISKEYIALNQKLHMEVPSYGMGGSKHKDAVLQLSKDFKTNSILDFGCGKGQLARSLTFPIWEYDPAIPEKSAYPKPADIVIATDVLEHIEPDKLKIVLSELKLLVLKVGYFVISTRKATKSYANGQNAHLIVKGKEWWEQKLSAFFDVHTIVNKEAESELHVFLKPKQVIQPETVTIENKGKQIKFYTPNETTKWRAKSLLTKEPSTIKWIEQMKEGEVLFDVGANIGSYSVFAGVNGVKVFSFEPEAENYALLIKNLELNKLERNAYCLALSDEQKAGVLYTGTREAGSACHSFDENVGHDLKANDKPFSHGCFGVTIDQLVNMGIPSPQHIKIDVDGFEYKVVQGARQVLSNGVKTMLVEINDAIPQHREMIEKICEMGFDFDQAQVETAKRKDGTFKGVAEYIFFKKEKFKSDNKVVRKVNDATIQSEPFNHIYIEKLFPNDVYERLMKEMSEVEYIEIEKSRGTKGYPKRFTGQYPKFLSDVLLNGEFKKSLLKKFCIEDNGYSEDVLLVRDNIGYSIPPHTDSTSKIITVLIYLPEDNTIEGEGTSMFMPKQSGFKCKTGRHYNFEDFDKVKTLPFRKNSMFAFARTDNSFHGVEPCNHVRNVLLYNIKK